jgi:hypothetical protein
VNGKWGPESWEGNEEGLKNMAIGIGLDKETVDSSSVENIILAI